MRLFEHPDFQIQMEVSKWKETRNPVYLWNAVSICTDHKKPLPSPVLDYLAEVAQRIRSKEARECSDLRKVLPKIMGFPEKGRGPGRLLDPGPAATEGDWVHLAVLFGIELERGQKITAALRNAASKLPNSVQSANDKTKIVWIEKALDLEHRSRTAAEWQSDLRSRFHNLARWIEQAFRETRLY
jgi:hypothetical protein